VINSVNAPKDTSKTLGESKPSQTPQQTQGNQSTKPAEQQK